MRGCVAAGQLIVIATDAENLLGVLFTSEKSQAVAPPVVAMLAALYAEVVARRSGQEAVLFIKAGNERSLRAHARLGMVQVASFTLGGEIFTVLSKDEPFPFVQRPNKGSEKVKGCHTKLWSTDA